MLNFKHIISEYDDFKNPKDENTYAKAGGEYINNHDSIRVKVMMPPAQNGDVTCDVIRSTNPHYKVGNRMIVSKKIFNKFYNYDRK